MKLVKHDFRGRIHNEKKKWNKSTCCAFGDGDRRITLSGCGGKRAEKKKMQKLSRCTYGVQSLYEKYAPYIQEQLPDINVEFVVGNNDLDFYRFLE